MIFSKIDRFLFHSFSLGPPSRLVWTVINVGPRDDRMAIRPVLEERFDRLLTGAHDDNVHFLDQPGFPFSSLTGHLWAHNCVLEERPTVDARPRMTADRSRERKGSSGWIKEEKRKWKQYERSRSLSLVSSFHSFDLAGTLLKGISGLIFSLFLFQRENDMSWGWSPSRERNGCRSESEHWGASRFPVSKREH